MRIYEHQAKRLLADEGVRIPRGRLLTRSGMPGADAVCSDLGRCVLKAQTYAGGRRKAGLISRINGGKAAAGELKRLFAAVDKVLVEEQVDIDREFYAGFTLDRNRAAYTFIFSEEGGVEIEELARRHPERIITEEIDLLTGLLPYQVREVVEKLKHESGVKRSVYSTIMALYRVFIRHEATLCEINPLVVTSNGEVVAVDAKIIFDDDALFRHKDILALRAPEDEDPLEREARDKGLHYVKMDGDVGCMVNGAGLAMATLDVMKHFGAAPANFLDIGGSAKAEQVRAAFSIINRDSGAKAIFVNIFGGIVRCDEVARGIVAARGEYGISRPLVIRLAGTNDAAAYEILKESGMRCFRDMTEAAKAVVSLR